MNDQLYPAASPHLRKMRQALAPGIDNAFRVSSKQVRSMKRQNNSSQFPPHT
jgi:hypothetical protein